MGALVSNEFAGQRIAIFGCAHGHGLALAQHFSRNNAELILLDHNQHITQIRDDIVATGAKAVSYQLDVENIDQIKEVIHAEGSRGLDGLIYVPRARIRKSALEIEVSDWNKEIQISLSSAFFATQTAALYLNQRKENFPFIIFISSVLSTHAGSESVAYHVAKGGINQLTRVLAVEYGPLGIRVNAVSPGWNIKDSHMQAFYDSKNETYRTITESSHPLGLIGDTQDIAEAVHFLASKRAKFITGQILEVNGGVLLREPSHFYLDMMKKMGQV
jgi:NAD(P)-dependent dehydrogenase (short-subunit alcohol dehydrogenase family)